MIWRILSTIVLWALVLAVLVYGDMYVGTICLALVTLPAQYEAHQLLAKAGYRPWNMVCLLLGALLVLGVVYSPISGPGNLGWLPAWLALAIGMFVAANSPAQFARLLGSAFAILYIPDLTKYFALILREFHTACYHGDGLGLIVWVIAVAKFTDVGGFLIGSAIGRFKLAPSISPGKTWEGVGGGILLAVIVGALGARYAPAYLPSWLDPRMAVFLAIPLSITAIVSDLSESALKRLAGVKDSGRTIPGIGGVLDLLDSLLLTAPIAYYLFQYVAHHQVR